MMFCPKGFQHFHYFASYAGQLGQDFYFEVLVPWVRGRVEEVSDQREEIRRSTQVSGLLTRWLIDHALFMQPVPIYAFSPDGRIVRVSPQLAEVSDNPSNYLFEWPTPEGSEMARFLDPSTKANRWCFTPEYPLIDEYHWQLTVSDAPRFLERGEDIPFIVDDLRRAAAPFDGWFLCVDEADSAKLIASMETEYLAFRSGQQESPQKRGPGRTRKKDGVREAYQAIFPDGHGNLTVKEIAERLRAHVPYPFEEDTVRRAIGLRS